MKPESKLTKFTKKLQEIYPDKFQDIVATHYYKRPKTFRINLLKSSPEKVLASLQSEGFNPKPTILPEAYSCANIPNGKKLSESYAAVKSEIYIQNPSSMLPARILLEDINPKDNLKVLDMCAAPGSKTTMLYENLKRSEIGFELTAVEKDRNRFLKMRKILQDYGVENITTLNADARNLIQRFPQYSEYFDLILLDAPCTNEASIDLNDQKGLQYWNNKRAEGVSNLQKALILSAWNMLKPEGTMVYSTCTYSVEENEEVISWLGNKIKNERLKMKDEKLNLKLPNLVEGKTSYRKKIFPPEMKNAIRVLPDEVFEGFFVAKLEKNT